MFFEGCLKLAYARRMALQPSAANDTSIIPQRSSPRMRFLLPRPVVFAYPITLAVPSTSPLAFEPRHRCGCRSRVSEIKITLIQVVLVYLVVDSVTDVVEMGTRITWEMLVKPTAIVLIAGALRLLGTAHLDIQPDVSEQLGEHPTGWSTV